MWNHPGPVLMTVAHCTYQRKDSQLLKSHSKALFCVAYCLPSVEMFLSQFPSNVSLSNEAGYCHRHAVFGSAGSAALSSVKTLIK